jgi:hypothetical protein
VTSTVKLMVVAEFARVSLAESTRDPSPDGAKFWPGPPFWKVRVGERSEYDDAEHCAT